MNYFDFHCHLDDDKLTGSREQLLDEMKSRLVGACTIGVDADSSRRAVALATACEGVWASVGQHPLDNRTQQFQTAVYQRLIDEHPDQVVAVGECGLDYYWPIKDLRLDKISQEDFDSERQRQQILFRKNIALAIANNLPLMLHVRSSENTTDAHDDVLEILQDYEQTRDSLADTGIKVVFHFFTGDTDLAQRIVKLGYYISLPGVITFVDMDTMVQAIPLSRLFAETDSPYAAPKPHRGKTNTPLLVEHVYEKIAEIRGEDLEVVRKQILQNVQDFYSITL